MKSKEQQNSFDIVIFGATGFTGTLVAHYLAKTADSNIRLAIAGRNVYKLAALKKELQELNPQCQHVGAFHADIADQSSLNIMTASTKVLLNTAGPFSLYGEPVVRACVENGADYIDISGEAAFIRRLEQQLADQASTNEVRVITCCGFEAVVADLGTLFLLQHAKKDRPVKLRSYVRVDGNLSGGSMQTALNAMGDLAHAVLPPPTASDGRKVSLLKPRLAKDSQLGGWVTPMQVIDQDMVLRSAAAMPCYGPDFAYAHHIVFPTMGKMLRVMGSMINMLVMAQIPFTRRWMQSRLPQPGEGPSKEQRDNGWFNVRFELECSNQQLVAEVSGGDPGYGDTAKIVAQAGLCLVEDRDKLPEFFGLLTPAQAVGELLIKRLHTEGIRFKLTDTSGVSSLH